MTHSPRSETLEESCSVCGTDTPHAVRIEIREERPVGENRVYSREPYRITECKHCGTSHESRVRSA